MIMDGVFIFEGVPTRLIHCEHLETDPEEKYNAIGGFRVRFAMFVCTLLLEADPPSTLGRFALEMILRGRPFEDRARECDFRKWCTPGRLSLGTVYDTTDGEWEVDFCKKREILPVEEQYFCSVKTDAVPADMSKKKRGPQSPLSDAAHKYVIKEWPRFKDKRAGNLRATHAKFFKHADHNDPLLRLGVKCAADVTKIIDAERHSKTRNPARH